MKSPADKIISALPTSTVIECIAAFDNDTHGEDSPLRKLAAEVFNVPSTETTLIQFMGLAIPLAKEMAHRYIALKHGEEE